VREIIEWVAAAALLLSVAGMAQSSAAQRSGHPAWTVVGCDRMGLAVLKGEAPLFDLGSIFHGWGWKHTRLENLPEVRDGKVRVFRQEMAFYNNWWDQEPLEGRIALDYELKQTGPKTFLMTFACRPDREMQFAMPGSVEDRRATVGPVLGPSRYFEGGTCRMELADGQAQETPLPPPRGATSAVKSVVLRTAGGEATRFTFDPPLYFHRDYSEARFWLESGRMVPAGQTYTQRITMELPRAAAFEPDNRWVDTSHWFELKVDNDFASPSVIAMARWQDKPAGKHGFLQTVGDHFEFEDGTPAKFWGVNLINHLVDEDLFDRWAGGLSKYGVNLVRMVAFGRPNYNTWAHYIKLQDVNDGLKLDPESIRLFDYGFARMKENGIYVGFSPFYGWYPTPTDKERLINHDELMVILRKAFPCQGSFYGVTCIAPDVQDLQIQFHVNLLNHVNPYTGKQYADDPALAYVELQNEENAFLQLFQLEGLLAQCPTYQKLFRERFADWLKARYGDRQALARAWGSELAADESIEKANINPCPRWFQQATPRIADQVAFIYGTQKEYYEKFARAVRETGYRGALVGSCWQAANWLGHLYNVLSDRDIGHIDRHNYSTADLADPGVGLLSCGLQAVLDRPYSFSEWAGGYRVGMRLDVPMVAAYGMGLQGWDMSMQFAWADAGVLPYQHLGVNDECNDFAVLSQYPALARMVRRGDVTQGEVVGNRRVSLPALAKGDVGFEEQFSLLGGANNKRFNAAVPQAALAAGRVVIEYVDGPVDEPVVDGSAPYINADAHTVRSTTGQLLWDTSGRGFFTVDTPGTKGVVGYGGGRTFELGQLAISPETAFAQIYVSALGRDETIADARRLLITAMARMVDKGTGFDDLATSPMQRAEAKVGPLLIEPVRAQVTIKRRGKCRVRALDHEGRIPHDALELPVEQDGDGVRFTIDGVQTRTVYYLVEFL